MRGLLPGDHRQLPRPAGRPEHSLGVAPLHKAADHIELNLDPACPDQVLLDIERLAGEHRLMLFDAQDGSVYPPPGVRLPG